MKGEELVVQDNIQKGTVYVQFAIVFNEPQFSELVHEETDT